ncbi:MAG: hypothetical protein J6Y74_00065 [Clostridia bacterium]|nr:hypothetical protein [Clostridia bacterium]
MKKRVIHIDKQLFRHFQPDLLTIYPQLEGGGRLTAGELRAMPPNVYPTFRGTPTRA